MREILSPKVLGDETGVPEATLAQWRWNGTGPPFLRLGRRVAYRRVDVEHRLEAKVVTQTRNHRRGSG